MFEVFYDPAQLVTSEDPLYFVPHVHIVLAAINRICCDIKEKKGGSGADKLDALSKLLNSYSRLIERDKQQQPHDPKEDGDPNHCKRLEENKRNMRGIIR